MGNIRHETGEKQWGCLPACALLFVVSHYTRNRRRLREAYATGAKWGVGLDDEVLRLADSSSERIIALTAIKATFVHGEVVILKFVRGQPIAFAKAMFGDEVLAELARRVQAH